MRLDIARACAYDIQVWHRTLVRVMFHFNSSFSFTCRDLDEFTAPLSNITTSEKELSKSHYHAPKIKFTIIYRWLESGC